MTLERARELSQQAWHEMEDCKEWNAPLIKAILQACAEEREACAKICRSLHSGDAEFADWTGGFQSGCEDCEEAIRGAK